MNDEAAKDIRTGAKAYEVTSISLVNLKTIFRIRAKLPVTTMEVERLISKMERTISNARATMTEDRMESPTLAENSQAASADHWPCIGNIL